METEIQERETAWKSIATNMLYYMGGRVLQSSVTQDIIVIYPVKTNEEGQGGGWVVVKSSDLLAAFYGVTEAAKVGRTTAPMCSLQDVLDNITSGGLKFPEDTLNGQ